MIKAAIFDYGETLVSSKARDEEIVPRALRAAYRFLVQVGLSVSFEDFIRTDMAIFGRYGHLEVKENRDIPDVVKYVELLGDLFPDKSSAWVHRTATQADAAFWDEVARNYSASKGAKRSLHELKSMGLKMAVLSNHHSHRALVRHLKQLELDGYFARIFSSDQLGVRKPDPRAFAKCLSALKVGNAEAVFIGDSIKFDIAGAKARRLMTIIIGDQATERSEPLIADFKVGNLNEIPPIIRRLNKA